jgi:hypothetical protein
MEHRFKAGEPFRLGSTHCLLPHRKSADADQLVLISGAPIRRIV